MVQPKLDAEGRPVFRAIDYSKLDTLDIVNWNPGPNPGVYTGCQGCGWWNQNVASWWRPGPGVTVTKKMLTFKHKGDNVYEYFNRRFFPAGEGNYGFAVHMQRKFKYAVAGTKTQIFSFAGDDDAWVYLNGNLVIDLGGIHNPRFAFFVLGTEAQRYGIKEGDDVTIDFFQAERMPGGTQAIISTSVPCQNQ
jgi:fibro-slime domain-containing protein